GSRTRLDRFLVTESRLTQMHMQVDEARRDDQPTGVNFFNLGFRTSNFGFRAQDFSVGDVKISNFIPVIRRIDHTTVPNDGGVPRSCACHRSTEAIPPHKKKTAMRTARPLVT